MRERNRSSMRKAGFGYHQLECRRLLTTFTVDTTLDVVNPDDGLLSLREALIAANSNAAFGDAPAGDINGDRILFSPSFHGSELRLEHGELEITDDVVIGRSSTLFTISGGEQSRIFNIDTSERVAFSKLKLVNGRSPEGGAIRFSGGGRFVASRVNFQFNSSIGDDSGRGGAIYNVDGNISLGKSAFFRNTASADGGAIFSESGHVNSFETFFRFNEAHQGGAIAGHIGSYVLKNSTFISNSSTRDGGALLLSDYSATAIILDTHFSSNTVSDGSGGAIASRSSDSLYIFGRSRFSANQSHSAGVERSDMRQSGAGGAIDAEGVLRIGGASFYSNFAAEVGGAITASGARLTINDATFASNEATNGGGAVLSATNRNIITHSNFTGNSSGKRGSDEERNFGGALMLIDVSGGTSDTVIRNSEFSENMSGNGGGAIFAASTNLDIFDSTIESNGLNGRFDLVEGGGGVLVVNGVVNIFRSLLARNTANNLGGSVFVVGSKLQMRDSRITGSSARVGGGGVAIVDSSAVLVANQIDDNRTSGQGGGVLVGATDPRNEVELKLRGGSIENNSAVDVGGGVFVGENTVVSLIGDLGSTEGGLSISHNLAGDFGGGVFSIGQFQLHGVNIEANTSEYGAGLYINNSSGGSTRLSGNSFRSNRASISGGAAFVRNYAQSRDTFFETMSTFSENQPLRESGIRFL